MFKDLWWRLKSLILFEDVLGCLGKSLVVSGWYFGMPKLLGSLLGIPKGSVHAGLSLAEANPPIWRNNEMYHFFSPEHFETSKYQNRRIKLSKNHWVRQFFAFFRFVREILFVTVTFDHPV